MQQQTHEVLTNGLGSFAQVSPDYELAPVGLASMRQQAQRLAEHGRNGDIYVVHAAEGETVVPVEVLDANPMVKELLFEQMRDMGLDPGRYMVGNDLNSLNPETGMPEFFFKSIFKGIGKVIKKVVKVVKKIAPIVVPLAASAFGIPFLGPAFGAGTFGASFVGSGIGSLLGGDSIGTAFKKAFIGGGLASLGGLAKGAISPTGTALGGLEGSFTGSTPVFDAAGTQTGVNVAASPFGDKSIFGASDASRAGSLRSDVQFGEFGKGNIVKGLTGGAFGGAEDGFVPDPSYVAPANNINAMDPTLDAAWQGAGDPSKAPTMVAKTPAPGDSFLGRTFGETGSDIDKYMFGGGRTPTEITNDAKALGAKYIAETPSKLQDAAGLRAAMAKAQPGMLAKFGPSAALGLGAMYLGGGFKTGETGESEKERKAYEERFNQFKYGTGFNPSNNYGNRGVKLYAEGFQPYGYDTSGRPIMRAAAGGATFDPFNYTGTPLNREYTPPIQYQDSRNIFNPNFSPPPAPMPTYLDFQSSYAPLDVDPYYQSGYTPTASDPNAAPEDLYKPFDPSLDEITDETATSGIASIAKPVKPLFFFDDSPSDEEDDNASPSGAAEGAESVGADEESTPAGVGEGTTGTGTAAGTGPGEDTTGPGGGGGDDPGGGAGPGGPGGGGDGSPSGAEGVGGDEGPGGPGGGDDADGPSGDGDPSEDGEGSEDEGGLADGGYIGEDYRPRAQMLVEGPGTERSDDIPAMLSDGEFVLNARSVRGADPTGQGNRYLGAQNLYKMMRDFEMRA